MKSGTTNQIEGAVHEVRGTIKENVGRVLHDRELRNKGQTEQVAGKVQKKVGQIEKVLER